MALKQIGRYEIQRRLGKGGMGSLYLARDPGLDRLVAIKLLKEDYLEEQEFRERFAREARALARLRHPNIVVVYDYGEHEGRPFILMEYIDGETLSQRLARTPPLKLALGLAIVEDLCAGLGSAHGAGIVHRDIKPDNIMMDRQGVLKLLDFGIARNAHAESTHQMTQPGMIMGTYSYMSPEQLLGQMVDQRSDIFAVGAVLYQVIAREQAFPGAFGEVCNRVLTTGPTPLEERVPGVDSMLVQIVTRALERDPRDRYQDVNDMRQDLLRTRQRIAEYSDGKAAEETVVLPRTATARRQKDSEAKHGLVNEQLRLSQEAFARSDYDIALQYGERAAFVDPDNQSANELINKSRVAIEAKTVQALLKEADVLLSQNRIPEALATAEKASAAVPELVEAEDLRKQVQAVLDQVFQAREREDRINASLERARLSLDRREYGTALRAVYEVLSLDPDRLQARELEQRLKAELQAQRERERARLVRSAIERARASLADEAFEAAVHTADEALGYDRSNQEALTLREQARAGLADQRRALDAVAEARQLVADGAHQNALELLRAFTPRLLIVDTTEEEIAEEQLVLEQRRQEEERRRAEEERRKAEGRKAEELRRREAEQLRLQQERKRQAEVERQRQAEEQRRLEAERREQEEQRRLARQHEREKQRREEAERRRAEQAAAEAARRRQTGEESQRRIEARRHEEERQSEREAEAQRTDSRALSADAIAETVTSHRPSLGGRKETVRPRSRVLIVAGVAAAAALAGIVAAWPYLRPEESVRPTPPPATTSPPGVPKGLAVAVNAVPWARVRIVPADNSGVPLEKTTPFSISLPEGSYRFEFQHPAFGKATQTLQIGAGTNPVITQVMPGADVDRIVSDVLGDR